MGGLEFNKIFAAVLVAGIIAMLSGFLAEKTVHPEKLKEDVFAIAESEGAGAGGSAESKPEPILAMLATADIERGQKLSKACAACHSFDKGGANGVGPNLWGVVGATKQSHAGFTYSGVLNTNGGDKWAMTELNQFLWNPKKYGPGTKMSYAGLKKPEDRAALILWLNTLNDSPKALPSQADIDAEIALLAPPVAAEPATPEAGAEGEAAASTAGEVVVKTGTDVSKETAKEAVKPAAAEVKAPAAPAHH